MNKHMSKLTESNYGATWLTVTNNGTIIVRRAGKVPFEVPGNLRLLDLLQFCQQLEDIPLPVRAIDVDELGPAATTPVRHSRLKSAIPATH